MQIKNIIFIIFCAIINNAFAEEVVWNTKPPEEVFGQESFDLAWTAKGFHGEYSSLCLLCPQEAGPDCKPGGLRQNTPKVSGENEQTFQTTFAFSLATIDGNYYATPYAYYNNKLNYHAEPVLIKYRRMRPTTSPEISKNM